jgi:cytochrome c-type biogenesis protein CcmE
MKPKHRRLTIVALGGLALAAAATLILTAFQDSIVFFHSPSEIAEKSFGSDQRLRIGGLVEKGSVRHASDGVTTEFAVTDLKTSIPVSYHGILPDLFREGQGVVAEGHMRAGVFVATEVLAKHDEKYMPPEVAAALKKSGRWQEGAAEPGK